MEKVQEVRALTYVILDAKDLSKTPEDEKDAIDQALGILVALADDTGCNIGVALATEDGTKYRLVVFKESE